MQQSWVRRTSIAISFDIHGDSRVKNRIYPFCVDARMFEFYYVALLSDIK